MPFKAINYQNYITPSDYVKFEEGNTTIRIISNGGTCRMHGMKTSRGYVNMGICSENDSCENCRKGYEAKTRWIWVVYLPDFDTVRIMEVGKKVGDNICKIAKKNGDPQEYDLVINRTGEMLKTDYSVSPGKKTPLSDELLTKIKPFKELLIKKHFQA